MNLVLNVTDCISMKEPTYNKVVLEISHILSNKIAAGQLDSTKEHTLFVSTKFGAATVTIFPARNFQ